MSDENNKFEVQKTPYFDLYTFFQQQLRAEQNFLWIRFGIMIVSQATIFGFYSTNIGSPEPIKPVVLALVGLIVSILFLIVQYRTIRWIGRYIGYLQDIEEDALGDFVVNRHVDVEQSKGGYGSTRTIAKLTAWLIVIGWIALSLVAINQFEKTRIVDWGVLENPLPKEECK